jgi:hypothetical protein
MKDYKIIFNKLNIVPTTNSLESYIEILEGLSM